jgi:hypothetical protein
MAGGSGELLTGHCLVADGQGASHGLHQHRGAIRCASFGRD